MRVLHVDLDPLSPTFLHIPLSVPGDHDQLVSIGSWRLPRSRYAAATVLWRLWDIPQADVPVDPDMLELVGRKRQAMQIERRK